MISAWLNRTPVRIYSILGFPYMTASGRKRSLLKWTERIACLLSHEVFCVSHSLRQVAIQDGICPPHKIRVLRGGSVNGVDTSDRFNPSRFGRGDRCMARKRLGIDDNDFAIGFVGRIVRDKGIAELVSAWTSIRESHPTAHLVMVGCVEPQDPVDPETLKMLRNDARVHLTGSIDDTSMMYVAFDLVVLPTYREGFPNVPLEAAAMKLPVVATNIPGCIDAVQDGVTGTLVPPRDAEALRTAIKRYLDDPELREQHGKAGRERVLREFRQEDIWEAIYQEYARLLREKGLAVPSMSTEGEAV
jgi:glycosyltransferase involved in cell wall biosynthesis